MARSGSQFIPINIINSLLSLDMGLLGGSIHRPDKKDHFGDVKGMIAD